VRRRLIAAVSAVLLAVVGAAMLVTYVSGVDRRAAAGMEPTTVLVVVAPIAAGTAADALSGLVADKTLPKAAVADGALTSVADIKGLVATTDLQPGEQLLAGRFAAAADIAAEGPAQAPAGRQLVSILLDPQRSLGGHLGPGSKVAVFVSLSDPDTTTLTLRNVLVTSIQGGVSTETKDGKPAEPAEDAEPVPGASVMVTLAVTPAQATKLVFGADHGTVWLSLEPAAGQATS
jgi:pilus assembly protein CpaB